MILPPLNGLLAFVRATEHGQLRAAARQLNLTESAVSHQISRLEKLLVVRLLERGAGGVKLTPNGQVLFDAVRPALQSIAKATFQIKLRDRERISITMPHSFAALWYTTRLDRLCEVLPAVDCRLIPTQRVVDLQREGIDFAIRMGSGPWAGCESVPLCDEVITPICTPTLAEMLKSIGWNEFIARNQVIVNAIHPDEWAIWCRKFELDPPSASRCVTLPSFDIVANAAVAGLGIAMGRTPLTEAFESYGTLVRPFPERTLSNANYFLVWPSRGPLKGTHRTIHDWLLSEMR